MNLAFDSATIASYRDEKKLEDVNSLCSQQQQLPLERIVIKDPPSAAAVYDLFHYFDEAVVRDLIPKWETLLSMINQRCAPLCADVVKRRENINELFRVLVRRVVLEILSFDDNGVKIRHMLNQLDELYLFNAQTSIKRGKLDYTNVDSVHQLIGTTAQLTRDRDNDAFYQKHSGVRDRGRRPIKEKANKPNRVDAIRANYILSRKQVPPIRFDETNKTFFIESTQTMDKTIDISHYLVDFYPIFVKVLDVVDAAVPRQNNHGCYLTRLNDALRRLTSKEWPMKGLVQSIINAERILERRRIRVPCSDKYFCAYTGQPLVAGEEVWHIRILVNDAERYQNWYINNKQPSNPNTSREFTRSIRAYMMKTQVTSECSLFYAPLALTKERLSVDRLYSYNTLYVMMSQLRLAVHHHKLEAFLWHRDDKQNYIDIMASLNNHLSKVVVAPREQFKDLFLQYIFFATMYSLNISNLSLDEIEKINQYCHCLFDIVLDFIDTLFVFVASRPAQTSRLVVESLTLENFHVVEGEAKLPSLATETPLDLLLQLSKERRSSTVNLWCLESALCQHPYLFISLFSSIYTMDTNVSLLSFSQLINLLRPLQFSIVTRV
jgi:hypothetical protein